MDIERKPAKRVYDFTKVEDIDAAEANLNEVEQSYLDAERTSGLLWTLLTGKRRMDIAKAREKLARRLHEGPGQ